MCLGPVVADLVFARERAAEVVIGSRFCDCLYSCLSYEFRQFRPCRKLVFVVDVCHLPVVVRPCESLGREVRPEDDGGFFHDYGSRALEEGV